MVENADKLGKRFRERAQKIVDDSGIIESVRGKGLFNAMVVPENEQGISAWDLCMEMMERGVLAKPTHGTVIRFSPPLIIEEEELDEALDIIQESVRSVEGSN
jgi:ornithine--oxo-acid transaminase